VGVLGRDMEVLGLDMAWDRPSPAEIVAAGYVFVCRYVGEDRTGKDVTRAEAEALTKAGLAIVTNYEYAPGGYLRGYDEGRRVAKLADVQHRAAGGPPDRPIYFSVDRDVVTPADFAAAGEYFRGINDEIGLARTGVYGEYDVVANLARYGRARWYWQTYAWSGSPTRWFPGAHIRQVRNGIHIAGHDVDEDVAQAADFGQWTIGEQPMTPQDRADLVTAILDATVWKDPDTASGPGRRHTVQEVMGDLHALAMLGRTMYGPGTDAWLYREVSAAAAGAEQPVDVERLAADFVAAVFKSVNGGVRIVPNGA
jgi:hypothetical protein